LLFAFISKCFFGQTYRLRICSRWCESLFRATAGIPMHVGVCSRPGDAVRLQFNKIMTNPLQFSWECALVGFFGGTAAEVARWHKLLVRKRTRSLRISPFAVLLSLLYACVGAALSGTFASSFVAAFYFGASWPVVLSAAGVRFGRKGASGKRGEGKETRVFLDEFNDALIR